MIKDWFKNFLSTTALTLILISLYAFFTGDESVYLQSIFPSIAVNAIIHLGLLILHRINFEHLFAEVAIEFGFILSVVLLTGYLVGWFNAGPVWPTIGITLVVFVAACLMSIRRLNRDVEDINEGIRKRNMVLHDR